LSALTVTVPDPVTVSAPGPVIVPANRSANPPLSIVPPPMASVIGRATSVAAVVSRVPPSSVKGNAGRAEAEIARHRDRPALPIVPPIWVLIPPSVSVPLPIWLSVPLPLTARRTTPRRPG
jgi:hypothetical protein